MLYGSNDGIDSQQPPGNILTETGQSSNILVDNQQIANVPVQVQHINRNSSDMVTGVDGNSVSDKESSSTLNSDTLPTYDDRILPILDDNSLSLCDTYDLGGAGLSNNNFSYPHTQTPHQTDLHCREFIGITSSSKTKPGRSRLYQRRDFLANKSKKRRLINQNTESKITAVTPVRPRLLPQLALTKACDNHRKTDINSSILSLKLPDVPLNDIYKDDSNTLTFTNIDSLLLGDISNISNEINIEQAKENVNKPSINQNTLEHIQSSLINLNSIMNHQFMLQSSDHNLPFDPRMWTIDQVAEFILKLRNDKISQIFLQHEINGQAFLLLNGEFLRRVMKVNSGPSLIISNEILKLHKRIETFVC